MSELIIQRIDSSAEGGKNSAIEPVFGDTRGKISNTIDLSKEDAALRSMLSTQDQRNLGSSMSTAALEKLARLVVSFGTESAQVKARLAELGKQEGGLGAFFAVASVSEVCSGNIHSFKKATEAVQELLSAAAAAKRGAGHFPHPTECLARSSALYVNNLESFVSVAAAMAELSQRANTGACWFACQYVCAGFGIEFTNVAVFNRLVAHLSSMGQEHHFINLSSIPKASGGDVEKMFALLAVEKTKEDVLSKITSSSGTVAAAEGTSLIKSIRYLLAIPERTLQLDAQETHVLDITLGTAPETALALASSKNSQVRATAVTKILDFGVLETIALVEKNSIVCSSLRNANLVFAKAVTEALKNRSDELSRLDNIGKISVDETGGYSRADKNFAETFLSSRDQQVLRICKLVEANIPDDY